MFGIVIVCMILLYVDELGFMLIMVSVLGLEKLGFSNNV